MNASDNRIALHRFAKALDGMAEPLSDTLIQIRIERKHHVYDFPRDVEHDRKSGDDAGNSNDFADLRALECKAPDEQEDVQDDGVRCYSGDQCESVDR